MIGLKLEIYVRHYGKNNTIFFGKTAIQNFISPNEVGQVIKSDFFLCAYFRKSLLGDVKQLSCRVFNLCSGSFDCDFSAPDGFSSM